MAEPCRPEHYNDYNIRDAIRLHLAQKYYFCDALKHFDETIRDLMLAGF